MNKLSFYWYKRKYKESRTDMGLLLDVKVNGISSLSEARYAAGMGVKWLGFAFSGEKAQTLEQFQGIMGWLAGVDPIIEVEHLDVATQEILSESWEVPFIQFKSVDKDLIKAPSVEWIHSIQVDDLSQLETLISTQISSQADCVLVDAISCNDWTEYASVIAALSQEKSIIWQFPFDETNVSKLLQSKYGIQCIALNSGVEDRPGWQDLDDIMYILEALED
jgi:phosphoribosylanthranilate isomerase